MLLWLLKRRETHWHLRSISLGKETSWRHTNNIVALIGIFIAARPSSDRMSASTDTWIIDSWSASVSVFQRTILMFLKLLHIDSWNRLFTLFLYGFIAAAVMLSEKVSLCDWRWLWRWLWCWAVCLCCVSPGGVQVRGHQLAQHRVHRQHRLHQPDQQEAHSDVPPTGRGVQVSLSPWFNSLFSCWCQQTCASGIPMVEWLKGQFTQHSKLHVL